MTVFVLWLSLCCDCLCKMTVFVLWLSLCCDCLCAVTVFVLWLSLCCDCLCNVIVFVLWLSLCCDCLCAVTVFVLWLFLCSDCLCCDCLCAVIVFVSVLRVVLGLFGALLLVGTLYDVLVTQRDHRKEQAKSEIMSDHTASQGEKAPLLISQDTKSAPKEDSKQV